MRRQRWNKYYQKGWNDTKWSPPFDGWFDSDNDDTRAAREAYEQGWNDSQQLRGARESSWGVGIAVIVGVIVLAALASPRTADSSSSMNPVRQQQCSLQWRYTGRLLPNNDATWRYERYYTGHGYVGYDGMWYAEWRGHWVQSNGTWRREMKQFRICS